MPEENQTMEEIHTVEEVDTTNGPTPHQEENQPQNEQKNTVATVWMRFSIIWLIAIISPIIGLSTHIERSKILLFMILICSLLVFLILSPIFLVWFTLWIVGLFRKPRGKAWVAVCIPLLLFIGLGISCCYVWSCIKTPATDFYKWFQTNQETLNDAKFQYVLQSERDNTINEKSADEIKDMFEASTWSSFLEKGSYLFSFMFKEVYESSLEKYNNGELPEIINEDENLDIDIDTDNEDDANETDSDTNNEDNENIEQEEITIEEPKKEKSETFSQSEKNDIEQVLNFIE